MGAKAHGIVHGEIAPDVRTSAVVGCGCIVRTSGYETTMPCLARFIKLSCIHWVSIARHKRSPTRTMTVSMRLEWLWRAESAVGRDDGDDVMGVYLKHRCIAARSEIRSGSQYGKCCGCAFVRGSAEPPPSGRLTRTF